MRSYGRATNSLDAKGRVSLPSRFRQSDIEYYVLNRGLEGCLYLYTPEQYEKTLEKLQDLNENKKKIRFFTREWTKFAIDVTLDKQYRILIPRELMELTGLKKEVVFQGANDRVEIWDPERQEAYTRNFEKEHSVTFEDIAEIFD